MIQATDATAPAVVGFDAILKSYHGLVLMNVNKLVRRVFPGGVPEELHDELVQAGRIGLWRAARAFDPGRGFRFTSLAQPAIQRHLIKAMRGWERGAPPRGTGQSLDELMSAPEEEGEAMASLPEALTEPSHMHVLDLSRAIAALPEEDAGVLQMIAWAGLSQREVALRLGCSEASISRRISVIEERLAA